jgi:hypothetical protein
MSGRTNRRGVAAPLDMVIFESDEYTLLGWDMLSAHKDRLWTLKQCKKYITASHIARLWYCDDMDAVQGWVARWEFRMTACVCSTVYRGDSVYQGGSKPSHMYL